MKTRTIASLAFLCFFSWCVLWARPDVNPRARATRALKTASDCTPSTSTATLDINNLRALLQNGGDMWWDLSSNPRYEIPKVSDPAKARHSLFAGSLWIGGVEVGTQQLRIAAQTYRQSGNDFFPGPLRRSGGGNTDQDVCKKWDRHFKIDRAEIDRFRADFNSGAALVPSRYPNVFGWPANNNDAGFDRQLAPYVDVNGDQVYNPNDGDYPDILGDQAIWWVINDKGNIHSETNGEQIGVEIQVMAFAFATSNAVNNMSFYKYRVINRSTFEMEKTYMGQWVDADLGYFADDYVGCDTVRGLGICYNGDDFDETAQGYGKNPPAVGVDFFQGPIGDANGNGVIDTICNVLPGDSLKNKAQLNAEGKCRLERIQMEKFIYYNNDFSVRGNPEQATHFYGYLTGFWKDGNPVVDDRTGNGNGYPDVGETYTLTNFMFPDYPGTASCPYASPWGTPRWDEAGAGNPPYDRRMIQSAGPFVLRPGAENEIVIGVVWARDENNVLDSKQFGSVCALLQADDIAQALYDSGFDLLDGPNAPSLYVEEFDQEIILYWENDNPASNNRYENYVEFDPILSKQAGVDADFRFQGYLVYQLREDGVGADELNDITKARLVAQCDLKDDVSVIVNREEQPVEGLEEPLIVDRVMVSGANQGLFNSVRLREDLFAEGSDRRLVNYRTYYYTIIAYAHNDTSSDGKKFLPSRQITIIPAMPHKTQFEKMGMTLQSAYGAFADVKLVAGSGSGGAALEFTDETFECVVNGTNCDIVYRGGNAPVSVKVVNAKKVKPGKYRVVVHREQLLDSLFLDGEEHYLYMDWELLREEGNRWVQIYRSEFVRAKQGPDTTTRTPVPMSGGERYIRQGMPTLEEHGFSISVKGVTNPGNIEQPNNGFVAGTIVYGDPTKPWLQGLPDVDATGNFDFYDWIRSGPMCREGSDQCKNLTTETADKGQLIPDVLHRQLKMYDPDQKYEDVLGGTWAPYCMTATYDVQRDVIGLSLPIAGRYLGGTQGNVLLYQTDPANIVTLDKLPNIDVVFTSDPALWSKCVVVETSPSKGIGSGSHILTAKYRKSRKTVGDAQNANFKMEVPDAGDNDWGMSYFPGYAVNLDNGERVNVFFGEATWYRSENGDDMLFNPTSEFRKGTDWKVVGGRHYIYVTNEKYDGCERIAKALRVPPNYLPVASEKFPIRFAHPDTTVKDTINIAAGYQTAAWAAIPLVVNQYTFKTYSQIRSEVKVSLRVDREFANAATGNQPTYEFTFAGKEALTNLREVAVDALGLINIVPNPYYATSGFTRGRYERSQLDQRVKITNLPQKCTIRIFTLMGGLVRTYNKDNNLPEQDWDLKNDYGTPIGGGMYIIHVDAGELGQKVLKFLCIMPEADLNAY